MSPVHEPISPDLYFALSQFLYDEAALLDARDWDRWGQLFHPEGTYWVPAAPA